MWEDDTSQIWDIWSQIISRWASAVGYSLCHPGLFGRRCSQPLSKVSPRHLFWAMELHCGDGARLACVSPGKLCLLCLVGDHSWRGRSSRCWSTSARLDLSISFLCVPYPNLALSPSKHSVNIGVAHFGYRAS
jgi:hypothetical protein